MDKKKTLLIGIIFLVLVFSATTSSAFFISNQKSLIKSGGELEITTDKENYKTGENVIIFFTNIGDEILSGGGPTVTIFNSEDEIVYQEACYCWWELEPGEYEEWIPWDQTDKQGQQVAVGKYTVEGFISGKDIDYVDTTVFYIKENFKPSSPVINGPNIVKIGKINSWTFMSTDPEGDDITYYVDFGDICGGAEYYGPYASGEEMEISHRYFIADTFLINAMAIDDPGAESETSVFEVTIKKPRFVNSFFTPFFQFFPKVNVFIKQILSV